MSTLVLKSHSVIANPKYGKLIDLNDGLRVLIDARKIDAVQGATVSSFTATGNGSPAELNFSEKRGDWIFPTFDKTAKKSLRFNGSALLANTTTQDAIVTSATYVVVCKIDTEGATGGNESRVFTGSVLTQPDTGYHSVLPRNGKLYMVGSSDVPYGESVPVNTDWFVGVFVFDGENSKFATSYSDGIVRNPRGISNQDKLAIGGNINKSANLNGGLKGNIALFAQYEKAMSDNEMVDIMRYYKEQFGI